MLEKENENLDKLTESYRESLIELSALEKSIPELKQEIIQKNLKIRQIINEFDLYRYYVSPYYVNPCRHTQKGMEEEGRKREVDRMKSEVDKMEKRHKESETQLNVLIKSCDHLAKQIDENKNTITNLKAMNDSLKKSNSAALVHETVDNSVRISECDDTIQSHEQKLDNESSKIEEENCVDSNVKSKEKESSFKPDNVMGILEDELDKIKKNVIRLTKLEVGDHIYNFGYIAAAALIVVYCCRKVFSK